MLIHSLLLHHSVPWTIKVVYNIQIEICGINKMIRMIKIHRIITQNFKSILTFSDRIEKFLFTCLPRDPSHFFWGSVTYMCKWHQYLFIYLTWFRYYLWMAYNLANQDKNKIQNRWRRWNIWPLSAKTDIKQPYPRNNSITPRLQRTIRSSRPSKMPSAWEPYGSQEGSLSI